jgi:rhamnose utilization protein RhaD (predicted bifunctional aldolase and dehydrogenase)
MMPIADVAQLESLCARLGADPQYVQGGGGNASLKHEDALWVKASGTWLANATREQIFVPVRLDAVRAGIQAGEEDPVSRNVVGAQSLRPSIETTLHALLPHRIVLHLHSIAAMSAAIRLDGQDFAARRLAGLSWRWIPYHRPGLPLTRAVAHATQGVCDILLLANHGVVVGAEDCAGAEALIRDVERRLREPARDVPIPDLDAMNRLAGQADMRLPRDAPVHSIACDPTSFRRALQGPLFPDQVVFLGPIVHRHPAPSDAVFALVEGRGVLVSPSVTPGQQAMLLALALLLHATPAQADIVALAAEEVAALAGWEAERYRIALDARHGG